MNFTWVPFYKGLAQKVAAYQGKPKELAALLVEVLQEQMGEKGADWLRDKDARGHKVPLDAIDPFTFFAAFNRGIKKENRIGILKALKQRLQVSAAVPSDFDGIPVVQNLKAWFFPWAAMRSPEDIPNLWKLAAIAIKQPPGQIPSDLFDACVRIEQVSLPKLTMGLFWLNPDQYLAVDSVIRGYVENKLLLSPPGNKATRDEYIQFIQQVLKAAPGKRFCDLSYEAWMASQKQEPAHWVMALGKQSVLWNDCHAKGIVRVGWDRMKADLGGLTEAELKELNAKSKEGDFKGIRDYVRVMRPGDRVFIKQGVDKIIAYGEIMAGSPETNGKEYLFKPELKTYVHIKPAKWLSTGNWSLPKGMKTLPQKTITPINDQNRLQELLGLIGWRDGDSDPLSLPGLNVILYGPPGTGKTYELQRKYFPMFTEKKTKAQEQYAQEIAAELSWWETTAVVVYDLNKPKVSVSEILAHPLMAAKIGLTDNKNPRASVWAALQIHTKEDCALVKYGQRSPPLFFAKDADSMWTLDRQMLENEFPDLVDVPRKLKSFTPVESEVRRYRFVTFHQSFSYEDFVEGIKPIVRSDAAVGDDVSKDGGEIAYVIKRGVFRELAEEARKDPSHGYALFIDEINRGNVANIFGELITLIEEDKRLDAEGDLDRSAWTVTLPYSRQRFGVPRNLRIIGTMNTADRSIEALDTALRRRFLFVPTYPKPDLLRQYQPDGFGVDLLSLLKTVNERLEVVLDRDHTIGHSYLMAVKNSPDPLEGLRQVFASAILPLLQEYFYGNPARIGMVLGSAFVRKRTAPAKLAKGDWDTGDAEEKEVYEISPQKEWTLSAFQSIYA
jgi:hypothetical protein